jgi:hypothetical protein
VQLFVRALPYVHVLALRCRWGRMCGTIIVGMVKGESVVGWWGVICGTICAWVWAVIGVIEPLVVVTVGLTEGVMGARYCAVKPLAIWVIGAHVGGVGAVEYKVMLVCASGEAAASVLVSLVL